MDGERRTDSNFGTGVRSRYLVREVDGQEAPMSETEWVLCIGSVLFGAGLASVVWCILWFRDWKLWEAHLDKIWKLLKKAEGPDE